MSEFVLSSPQYMLIILKGVLIIQYVMYFILKYVIGPEVAFALNMSTFWCTLFCVDLFFLLLGNVKCVAGLMTYFVSHGRSALSIQHHTQEQDV